MSLTEHPTLTSNGHPAPAAPVGILGVDASSLRKVFQVHLADGNTMIGIHADRIRLQGQVLEFQRFGQPVHSFNLAQVFQVAMDGAQRPRSMDLTTFQVKGTCGRNPVVRAEKVEVLPNQGVPVWGFTVGGVLVEAFVVANCVRMFAPENP